MKFFVCGVLVSIKKSVLMYKLCKHNYFRELILREERKKKNKREILCVLGWLIYYILYIGVWYDFTNLCPVSENVLLMLIYLTTKLNSFTYTHILYNQKTYLIV